MESPHLSAIQNLVGQADVLTSSEKKDWLGLLELMNDRQLLQLEQILIDAVKSEAEEKRQQAAQQAKATAPAVPPARPAAPADSSSQNSFKHILNFPVESEQQNQQSGHLVPAKTQSKTAEPKKPSPFAAKLKTMFSEKELPPAHLGELAAPAKQQTPVKSPIIASPKPAAKPALKPEPPAALEQKKETPTIKFPLKEQKPDNVTINVFVNSPEQQAQVPGLAKAEEALRQVMPQVASSIKPNQSEAAEPVRPSAESQAVRPVPSKPAPEPSVQATPSKLPEGAPLGSFLKPKPAAEQEEQAAVKRAPVSEVIPGLNFMQGSGASESVRATLVLESKAAAKAKQETDKSENVVKIVLEDKSGDDMHLETLADLAALTPSDFQQHATGTLYRKIQKLVTVFDPHEVSFNLEKSPLYKAYVATGVVWLKSEGGKAPTSNQPLPRADFERFADLLILMRSGS